MAISAYLEASWTRDRPDLRERAVRALDFLWVHLRDESGVMCRYLPPPEDSSNRGAGVQPAESPKHPLVPGLLGDQAWTAAALLDAYEVTGDVIHLSRAQELLDLMIDRLGARGGGFFDTPAEHETLGRLSMRQRPVKENAIAAMALIRLARLTHEQRYEDIARETLEQFVSAAEAQGYFASDYARAVDMLLNPGADVKIVADAADASTLRAAALALAVPDRIVRVIDPSDATALDAESLPSRPAPAAYVCYGTLCSAPVTRADDLIEITDKTRQAFEATRTREPLLGPRGPRASD
jgi:uncharacterized protein YyaL (SSP411 family)